MIRDLSPTSWNAPGTMEFSLLVQANALSDDPLEFDTWISSYAPLVAGTLSLASGDNNTGLLANPDSTHARLFIFIPPRGNTTAITLKGVAGDTGLAQHPNGVIVLTCPASTAPSYIMLNAGDTIAGCRVYWL